MKLSSRLTILMLAALLAACGFRPIYGTHTDSGTPVAAALGTVQIANIPDRQGQMLRNHLIDRMYLQGRPAHPSSLLNIKLTSSINDLGIQQNATATRSELNLNADYSLRDLATNKVLVSGSVHSIVNYGKLGAQYGTVATEQNATDRALTEVGEQIVNRLSLYFAEKRPEPATRQQHPGVIPSEDN